MLLDRVTPTPAVSWAITQHHAAGGIVVTASHNSAEFNGIKYKPDFGGSAPPEIVAEIERHTAAALESGVTEMTYEEAAATGRLKTVDPLPDFFVQLGRMVDLDALRGHGLRVLHEAMYGAGAGLIARALNGGSTTVEELHGERNPGFGGMHPEPIDRYMPEAMERMRSGEFDLGIANDGDADRVGIIDETGRYINQLQVMALFAMYLLEKRGLSGDIVRSVTTSGMLDSLGERFGVTVHEMPVGFKYIGTKMMETDAILGGEESGGYAFRGHIPERDGILSGLMMAAMIVDYALPLSAILAHLEDLVGPARVRPPRYSLPARRIRGAQGADLCPNAAERAGQPRGQQGGAHPYRRRLQVLPRRRLLGADAHERHRALDARVCGSHLSGARRGADLRARESERGQRAHRGGCF